MEEVVPQVELVEFEGDDEAGEVGGEMRLDEGEGEFGARIWLVEAVA
jgi:hypothetical protein